MSHQDTPVLLLPLVIVLWIYQQETDPGRNADEKQRDERQEYKMRQAEKKSRAAAPVLCGTLLITAGEVCLFALHISL